MKAAALGLFSCLVLLAGAAGCSEPAPEAPPTTPQPREGGELRWYNETSYFNASLPAGAYREGDFSQVQRAVHPLPIERGIEFIRVTLEFTAQAGDLDFHLERPDGKGGVTLYGQEDGHAGGLNQPAGGTISVPHEDVVAGNWSIVVHTGETGPANAHTEAAFTVRIDTGLRAARFSSGQGE